MSGWRAEHGDLSAGRLQQPGHQPHRRRLAAAAGTDEAEDCAALQGEVERADHLAVAERLGHLLGDEQCAAADDLARPRWRQLRCPGLGRPRLSVFIRRCGHGISVARAAECRAAALYPTVARVKRATITY